MTLALPGQRIVGADVWAISHELTSSNNRLRVNGVNLDLPVGRYFALLGRQGAVVLSGYLLLFEELAVRVVADLSKTLVATHVEPVEDGDTSGCSRIKLAFSDASALTIDWDLSTLDPKLLGWPAGQTGTSTSTGGVLQAPRSVLGSWVSRSLFGGVVPDKKPPRKEADRRWSSEDTPRAVPVTFRRTKRRRMGYEYTYQANCHGESAADPALAGVAGLVQGDTHQGFSDVWEALAREELAAREVLICHDTGYTSPLKVVENSWEIVRAVSAGQLQDTEAVMRVMRTRGDIYWMIEALDLEIQQGAYVW